MNHFLKGLGSIRYNSALAKLEAIRNRVFNVFSQSIGIYIQHETVISC